MGPRQARLRGEALEVLTLDGPLITQMTAFMMPELFPHFGLPDSLPGQPG